MRVAIDVLGAPEISGGMRLYAEEVLRGWVESFPDDELSVFGYPWVTALGLPGVRVFEQPEGARGRVVGQWLRSGLRARRLRVDALVSVSQVVSPLFPRARRVCVVHDWRHVLRPAEFGAGQRAYRRLWNLSIARAAHAVAISEKTREETSRFVPGARVSVVANGRDHARRWPVGSGAAASSVVTFGHFVNKRPELVIDALAEIPDVRLVVVGARGAYADTLAARAAKRGIADRVALPGFVPEADYQALVRDAAVVVLASSDEGFGLPVSEAAYFGVPCVVTDDSGLEGIHGDRVRVAVPTADGLAAAIRDALLDGRGPAGSVDGDRWADTVAGLRGLLV